MAGAPRQIRWAGSLVGLEGLAGVGTAVLYVGLALAPDAGPGSGLWAGAGYFLIVGGAVLAVAAGLVGGRRWARTPAIVTQLLLLPVVYSLLGPSHQLALGIASGAVVVTALLLLISEPARTWWMDLESTDGDDEGTEPRRDDDT